MEGSVELLAFNYRKDVSTLEGDQTCLINIRRQLNHARILKVLVFDTNAVLL